MQNKIIYPGIEYRYKRDEVISDIKNGFNKNPKQINYTYLYDHAGSELFEKICETTEYYIPRCEFSILHDHVGTFVKQFNHPKTVLVDFGCGNAEKAKVLLNAFYTLKAYVPIDISCKQLSITAEHISADFPELSVRPICADYMTSFSIPSNLLTGTTKINFLPGTILGNLSFDNSIRLLRTISFNTGKPSHYLIGLDLIKDEIILNQAYNDSNGYTALFNKNILSHLNTLINVNFDLANFRHKAFYNKHNKRVEMYLISNQKQLVTIGDEIFILEENEPIMTEFSNKFSYEDIQRIAVGSGLKIESIWTDQNSLYSVAHLIDQ